eukprot:1782083-Rhodomonas_salina.1
METERDRKKLAFEMQVGVRGQVRYLLRARQYDKPGTDDILFPSFFLLFCHVTSHGAWRSATTSAGSAPDPSARPFRRERAFSRFQRPSFLTGRRDCARMVPTPVLSSGSACSSAAAVGSAVRLAGQSSRGLFRVRVGG